MEWTSNGSESNLEGGLVRGGRSTPPPDEQGGGYNGAHLLPGGRAVLLGLFLPPNSYRTEVLSLDTGERKIILESGKDAMYVETGHLIYEQAGTGNLMAVPFDLTSLEVTGDPVPVVQGVRGNLPGYVDYALSDEGTLVYVPGGGSVERSLVWVDREGTERLVTEQKRNFTIPRISPDGKRLGLSISEDDGNRNVWIYDIERDSFSRLTFEGLNGTLIWTPDGKWITYRSIREGPQGNLYRKPMAADRPSASPRANSTRILIHGHPMAVY